MKILKDMPFFRIVIEFFYTILLIVVVSSLIGLILAFPVMFLWNFVFHTYPLTIFQAWALTVLAGILFGQKGSSNK